jgi:hypothetical protein
MDYINNYNDISTLEHLGFCLPKGDDDEDESV